MKKNFFYSAVIAVILLPLLFAGCGYQIKYKLNEEDIAFAKKSTPLKVQAVAFSDQRDEIEKEKKVRKSSGYDDLSDYTYDKEFKGKVSEEITKMTVNHINFSRTFAKAVTLATENSAIITDESLDALNQQGIDALLTGEIEHFYGYYDQSLGRQLLYEVPLGVLSGTLLSFTTSQGDYQITYYWYGPGLLAGAYLESLHKRKIENRTQLKARLISTKTHQIAWEDDFDIFRSENASMPGVATQNRKHEVAVHSLRDAVNQIVQSISTNSELIVQNMDKEIAVEAQRIGKPSSPGSGVSASQPVSTMHPSEDKRSFAIGMRLGLNISSYGGGDADNYNSKTGFFGGAFATFPLGGRFFLQPEIVYSMQGAVFENTYVYTSPARPGLPGITYTTDVSVTESLNYLDIPLLLSFSILDQLNLSAGPSVCFYLNGKAKGEAKIEDARGSSSQKIDQDIKSKEIHRPEYGVTLGGSFLMGKVDIGARYYLGLTKFPKRAEGEEEIDVKNQAIQVLMGFRF